ncbi:MAG: hypothetical protein JRI36_07080, partial [Deltaproteobacteria bacterium]|nr:hypothetical protein [Deltaproteobacteria bacterium]
MTKPGVRASLVKGFLFTLAVLWALLLGMPRAGAGSWVHHDLTVRLLPESHELMVRDTVTLPEGLRDSAQFLLHQGLSPVSLTPGTALVALEHKSAMVPLASYRVQGPGNVRVLSLQYKG